MKGAFIPATQLGGVMAVYCTPQEIPIEEWINLVFKQIDEVKNGDNDRFRSMCADTDKLLAQIYDKAVAIYQYD